ncbi:MAG: DUF305 domain-containing protein [Balneolaceae bacterium]|nr:DUF305 domain-containing protein [Balneolaceae bacterium]
MNRLFLNMLVIIASAGLLLACSTSKQTATATNTNETSNQEEVTLNDTRDKKDIEELFWARRDSTKMNYAKADVEFMQGMIGHHSQALIMSSLAKPNDASKSVQTLAARIINAQKDEIAIMQRWLSDRNEMVPQVTIDGLNLILTPGKTPSLTFNQDAVVHRMHEQLGHGDHHPKKADEKPEEMRDKMHAEMDKELNKSSHMGHKANNGMDGMMHDHSDMPGMLSQTQLEELAMTKGTDFDRLFLRYMIQHHAGAITMVNDLVRTDGAAQEVSIGKLAGDINVDQKTEIERMRLMLMQIMQAEQSQ